MLTSCCNRSLGNISMENNIDMFQKNKPKMKETFIEDDYVIPGKMIMNII